MTQAGVARPSAVQEASTEVQFDRFVVESAGGRLVPAIVALPTQLAPGPRLILHGHMGPEYKDMPQVLGRSQRMALATGCIVLTIDGPAHGDRAPVGANPEESYRLKRMALVADGVETRMAEDWAAALDACVSRYGIKGPVAYVGWCFSMLIGPAVVSALSAVSVASFGLAGLPRVGALVESARSRGEDERLVSVVGKYEDAEGRGRRLLASTPGLGNRQVLVVARSEDEIFPLDGAVEVFGRVPGPKRMAIYPGGHTIPLEAERLVNSFVVEHLLQETESEK